MQSLLQVDEVIAAALKAQSVNLTLCLLALDLRLLFRVRNQQDQFLQELLENVANAALRNQ